jgi:radical SAM protein with 4Fe4S-binding SPASM domain
LGVRVKISLDGATAETHDALRGSGTFARTCEVLGMLAGVGARDLTIHYTVHRKNFAELELLPDLLEELGVTNVVIGTIKPSGRALCNEELLIPPRMVPFVQQKIRAIKKRANIDFLQYQDRGWDGFGCPATCNKLGITATGRLTTCAFFGQELLGESIRDHSLQELWRRHLQRGEIFVANEQCASCSGLAQCGGGCRARALYYRGDINAVDPYCCAMVGKQAFVSEHRELLLAARDNPLEGFGEA